MWPTVAALSALLSVCFSPLTVGNFDVALSTFQQAQIEPCFSPLTVGNFDVAP